MKSDNCEAGVAARQFQSQFKTFLSQYFVQHSTSDRSSLVKRREERGSNHTFNVFQISHFFYLASLVFVLLCMEYKETDQHKLSLNGSSIVPN